MRAGENRLRSMFLDPAERDRHPDWPRAIGGLVASFRASIGTDTDDPRVAQLVGELSLASEPFRKLWARHDVKALAGAAVQMRHPEVGELALRREKLPIGDSGGQLLVIYHAEPGSASARALSLLASGVTAGDTATAGDTGRARERARRLESLSMRQNDRPGNVLTEEHGGDEPHGPRDVARAAVPSWCNLRRHRY
jgi:hypothetical protein